MLKQKLDDYLSEYQIVDSCAKFKVRTTQVHFTLMSL